MPDPAEVFTIAALLGAAGITAIAWPRSDGTPDRPAEPDTRTAAEQADLIPRGGPTP
jgi:hypothetical protein